MNICPCGSNAVYADCCEPVICGNRLPETPEQLMRARYTAYTNASMDFLFESTHPDHRKGYDHDGTKAWAEKSEWHGLTIVSTQGGGPEDKAGDVEFIARFREKGALRDHHEMGHFSRDKGRWYFVDGTMVKSKPAASAKVNRNDPCPCKSGLKYKKCCGK